MLPTNSGYERTRSNAAGVFVPSGGYFEIVA
jgi:hypothetical protein